MDISNRDGAAADTTDRTQTSSDVAPRTKPLAVVEYFDVAHGGPGWYWHSSLTDDAVGPFDSDVSATTAATSNGYRVNVIATDAQPTTVSYADKHGKWHLESVVDSKADTDAYLAKTGAMCVQYGWR